MAAPAKELPLHRLHVEHGAKFAPFAGYSMPLNYTDGILKEHRWCRSSAAFFDVSHMGQVLVSGSAAAAALESLIPADLCGLAEGQSRYCLLTNESGGVLDDLIATRLDAGFHIVVNAGRREEDLDYLRRRLGDRCAVRELPELCLLALQGPAAAGVMECLGAAVSDLPFMWTRRVDVAGVACRVSRSGYTGEDGFELSLPSERAPDIARLMLDQPEVRPAGLGARDSLRLEAGLCLYGHELDMTTTPIEADLAWTIGKARRAGGSRAHGYPGAEVIARQLAQGADRKRVGLLPQGKALVREAAEVVDGDGHNAGRVTSGGFSPTLERPIAMAYVRTAVLEKTRELVAISRGREVALTQTKLPFVAHRYFGSPPK
jgi:aminomethyltransferase